ncbi:hypothetical protein EON64_20175, partial [archaeon]
MEKKLDLTVYGKPCKRWPVDGVSLSLLQGGHLLQHQDLFIDKHDVRLLLEDTSAAAFPRPIADENVLGYDGDDDVDMEALQEERYRDDLKRSHFQSERELSKLERERQQMQREAAHLSVSVGLTIDVAAVSSMAFKEYRVLLHTVRRVREQGVSLELLLKSVRAQDNNDNSNSGNNARSLCFLDASSPLHSLYEQLKEVGAPLFWALYM